MIAHILWDIAVHRAPLSFTDKSASYKKDGL
jgi:hypothetical protein